TRSVKSTINAHRGSLWALQFSPNGELLATAGDDGLIEIWNPDTAESVKKFKHPNAVRGIAFSRDGETFFAGDRSGTVKVWSMNAEEPIAETQQPGAVYALAISP